MMLQNISCRLNRSIKSYKKEKTTLKKFLCKQNQLILLQRFYDNLCQRLDSDKMKTKQGTQNVI